MINISSGVNGVAIDSFTTVSGPTADGTAAGSTTNVFPTAPTTFADVLGGQRDFTAEILTFSSTIETVRMFNDMGSLFVNPDFNSTGRYTVTWDGLDTAGGGLNHTGLGNVDLTAVNNVTAVGTGICIHDAEFDEPNGIIRLRVYTDSTHFSEAVIANIPENTRQDFFIPFSGVNNSLQFVPMGTAGGATFTNVGAVQLEVQSVENAMAGQIGLLNVIGPGSEVENIPNAAPPTAIDIEKFTNGIQADTAGGADVPILISGNTVTWRYVVSNTGGVSLTNVAVTDDRVGAITNLVSRANGNQDNLLDPGEIWTFEKTGTVVSGSYENKGTVTALGGGQPVMDMDFSHYTAPSPAIDIEKVD